MVGVRVEKSREQIEELFTVWSFASWRRRECVYEGRLARRLRSRSRSQGGGCGQGWYLKQGCQPDYKVGDSIVVEGKQVDRSSGLEVSVDSGGVGKTRNEEGVIDALVRSNCDVDRIGPLRVK